jgi:hypothetical protein
MTVVTVLGQPANAGADDIQFVTFVWEFIDLFIFAVLPVHYFHLISPL